MPEEPPAERERASHIVEWMNDPDFWRDVTTRTLSAAIVAVLAYVFALVAGYVQRPNAWRVVLAAVLVVVAPVVMVRGARRLNRLTARNEGGWRWWVTLVFAVGAPGWFTVAIAVLFNQHD